MKLTKEQECNATLKRTVFSHLHVQALALGIFNTLRATWFRRFSQKKSSFWLPYQRPSSSVHCARELFKGFLWVTS